jgi:CheY-like chemotaxis protein
MSGGTKSSYERYDSSTLPRLTEFEFPRRDYAMQTLSILVIDDVDDIVAEMIAMFALVGLHATGANSIGQGLERLRQDEAIGLIICDLHLPHEGGEHLARRIAADPVLADRNLDIVLMSGDGAATDRLAAMPGVTLLRKPIDPDILIRQVQECLDAKAA